MPGFDLHVHTTASDGVYTSQEIVRMALAADLQGIAITDHDTMSGVAEAERFALPAGLTIVPGVELSTEQEGAEVHILGYYLSDRLSWVEEKLTNLQNTRLVRMTKMVDKLLQYGYRLSIAEVMALAGPGSVGRPHVAQVLLNKGYVTTVQEAFQKLIGRGQPAYVPREKFSPLEAVEFVLAAGGIPVMAHPGLAKIDSLIPVLAAQGLQGLEVYHPDHTREMEEKYFQISDELDLLVTGGSDFHGINNLPELRLGCKTVDGQVVQKMAGLIRRR